MMYGIKGVKMVNFEKYKILPSRLAGSGERDYDVFRFDSEDDYELICFLVENKGFNTYDVDMRNYQLLRECKDDPTFAGWLYDTIMKLNTSLGEPSEFQKL